MEVKNLMVKVSSTFSQPLIVASRFVRNSSGKITGLVITIQVGDETIEIEIPVVRGPDGITSRLGFFVLCFIRLDAIGFGILEKARWQR